jgi:hypothetical protein
LKHGYTLFCKSAGERGGMFQLPEPVTFCDQFQFFFFRQPKHKIRREAPNIAPDSLI